jgi:hypothetical protein
MRVLIACEFSGIVREAFRAKGHDAWSCDLLPTEIPGQHYQGDVFLFIEKQESLYANPFDLMIAHPPCTYLAVSGLHWSSRVAGRAQKTEEALMFVKKLMDANITKIAIENPVSCISTRIRKPNQIVQPWYFGDDASKKTCLWLKNLPLLQKTKILLGDEKTRRGNQTPSGQNKIGPSPDRWKERSRSFQGIANAMADQWGGTNA